MDEEYQYEQLWSVWVCLFSMLTCLYVCVGMFMCVFCWLVRVIGWDLSTWPLIRDTHPHTTGPMRL